MTEIKRKLVDLRRILLECTTADKVSIATRFFCEQASYSVHMDNGKSDITYVLKWPMYDDAPLAFIAESISNRWSSTLIRKEI